MGNSQSQEDICKTEAEIRLNLYKKSDVQAISSLYKNDKGFMLKTGDIIFKDGGSSNELHKMYAVYGGESKIDKNLHTIITKCSTLGPLDSSFIREESLSLNQLKQCWKLIKDARYKDTYYMAKKILDENLDLGYSETHSNSEHFITFCLTRHNKYSISRERPVMGIIKDIGSVVAIPVATISKLASHPIYQATGGSFTYTQRNIKLCLPFGMDSDDNARAIDDNKKIWIGGSFKNPKDRWFPHD